MIKGTNTPTRDSHPGTYICNRCGITRTIRSILDRAKAAE